MFRYQNFKTLHAYFLKTFFYNFESTGNTFYATNIFKEN